MGGADTSFVCGNPKSISSLNDCKKTHINSESFVTYFECFPDNKNLHDYYQIRIESCAGYDAAKNQMVPGTDYNSHCTHPDQSETLHYEVKCGNKTTTLDVTKIFKFQNGRLVCA